MPCTATVARARASGLEYLAIGRGGPNWASSERGAVEFGSIREATRAALMLPGKLRAFAMPLRWEPVHART